MFRSGGLEERSELPGEERGPGVARKEEWRRRLDTTPTERRRGLTPDEIRRLLAVAPERQRLVGLSFGLQDHEAMIDRLLIATCRDEPVDASIYLPAGVRVE